MKLTVGQFQAIYQIERSDADEIDKKIQCVAAATGKTDSEVEDMSIMEVNRIHLKCLHVLNSVAGSNKPSNFLKVGKKLYQINYKPGTLTAGQNTELQHWMKDGDWIKNMDKILASIAVPIKRYLWVKLPTKNDSSKHEQVAEDMQQVDYAEAYGSVVFFCKVFAVSIKGILPSLEKQMLKKGKTKEEVKQFLTDLTKTLDGYTAPSVWQTSKG